MILTANFDKAFELLQKKMLNASKLTDVQRGDLAHLLSIQPILSKKDLSIALPETSTWLKKAVLFSETSGTTGESIPTPRGSIDLSWNAKNQEIAYKKFICSGDDRVAILHPSILSPFVEASSIALRSLNVGQVRVFPIPNICDYGRIFDVLFRYKITTIMSTPSLIYKLLYELKKGKGIPKYLCKLLITGEDLSLSNIENFKKILGKNSTVVPFVYGASETATLMTGRYDGKFDPLLDDFIFELHDTNFQNGAKKLVVTWLREGLMPILRYDTEDYFLIDSGVFSFFGRSNVDEEERNFQNLIENTCYSFPFPVFHYECKVKPEKKFFELSLVTLESNETVQSFSKVIESQFPKWSFVIKNNDVNMDFFQFSPKPKMQRFIKC